MLQPTVPAEGRTAPRIGNVGHMTRIANKLIEKGTNNSFIESYLQVATCPPVLVDTCLSHFPFASYR